MAKARRNVNGSSKVRGAVFNMVTPSSRVQVGEAEVDPKDGKPIKWGSKDDLPFEYLRLTSESSTASSCLRKKQQFIFADGFTDPDAAEFEVNESQSADALLQDISGDAGTLEGIALRVRYVEGKVLADNLPLECVRKLDNGFFLYNPTLGQKKVDKDLNEILPAYSTREKLIEEAGKNADLMAEKGQIYYYYQKVKGAYDYPIPVYASKGGLADIENDAEIALYDLDEVKSGFRLSAIMTVIGSFEDTIDENGNVIPNPELEGIKEQLKSFTERNSRDEARKKIALFTAESKENLANLTAFNNSDALELLDAITDRVANKVCRACNVPPVLIGMAKPGQLGQVQEVSNMIQLFNMDIVGMQNMIQRIFAELWPEEDWTISTLNPINYIPAEVLAKMTDEEIRALGGLATEEDTRPEEIKTLINNLKQLPVNVAGKVMERMSAEQLLSLVGLTPQTNDANNQTATT